MLLNITVGQHATANLTMSIKRIENISAAGMGVGDWRSDDSGELTSSADRRLDKAIGTRPLAQLFGC